MSLEILFPALTETELTQTRTGPEPEKIRRDGSRKHLESYNKCPDVKKLFVLISLFFGTPREAQQSVQGSAGATVLTLAANIFVIF